MYKTDSRQKGRYFLGLMVILVVLIPTCLSLICVSGASALAKDPNMGADARVRARAAALRAATRAATTGFRPSLEMKENADFLLTPALLMQEVLSDEIVTTYPSE